MEITCRVCGDAAPAQRDGVLLCPACRADPDATRALITRTVESAYKAVDTISNLMDLPMWRRLQALERAEIEANRVGGEMRLRFLRRRDATIAEGGPLAKYLNQRASYTATREWASLATRELDELAEQAVEVAHG